MQYVPSNNTNPYLGRYMQPAQGLKGRPVTSLEEAKVAQIDFDGSISFFPDLANGKIYTKQINMDGTVTMNMYTQTEIPTPKSEQELYVTKEEFQEKMETLNNLLSEMRANPASKASAPKPSAQVNF